MGTSSHVTMNNISSRKELQYNWDQVTCVTQGSVTSLNHPVEISQIQLMKLHHVNTFISAIGFLLWCYPHSLEVCKRITNLQEG